MVNLGRIESLSNSVWGRVIGFFLLPLLYYLQVLLQLLLLFIFMNFFIALVLFGCKYIKQVVWQPSKLVKCGARVL